MVVTKKCEVCGNEYSARIPKCRFCSHECYWSTLKGKPVCDRKQPTLTKKCEMCGKEFEKAYRFNIGRWRKVRFCSLACSGKFRSGDKCPAWRGGKTLTDRSARLTQEYKAFRKAIITRDGKKCTRCGSRHKLEIHHKQSFTHYPELRFVEANVVTLCVACHSMTDNYKGRGVLR